MNIKSLSNSEYMKVILGERELGLLRWKNLNPVERNLKEKYYSIRKIGASKSDDVEQLFISLLDKDILVNIKREVVKELTNIATEKGIKKLIDLLKEESGFVYGAVVFSLCDLYKSHRLTPLQKISVEEGLKYALVDSRNVGSGEELGAVADLLKDVNSKDIDTALDRLKNLDESDIGYALIQEVISHRKDNSN